MIGEWYDKGWDDGYDAGFDQSAYVMAQVAAEIKKIKDNRKDLQEIRKNILKLVEDETV